MKIKKTYQGELPENKIVNTESTSQTDTYSCEYINQLQENTEDAINAVNVSHTAVLWSGDIVPTALNTNFGGDLEYSKRFHNYSFGFARFSIDGTHYLMPIRFTTYGEGRTYCGYWAINSTTYAYLTLTYGGYGSFGYQVREISGKTVDQVHLLEIIGIK